MCLGDVWIALETADEGTGEEMYQAYELLLNAGREVIRREHEHFREAAIDDARHIPRLDRIATAMAEAAREVGASDAEAAGLCEELIAYGRKLWLDLCVSNAYEDEDPEAFRQESAEIFERIRTADDPWSVYR